MDIEKNRPSVPHLDESLKNNHGTNNNEDNEKHPTIKETIARNKKMIEKTRQVLRKS